MALTVAADFVERMVHDALAGLTVAYGGDLGTQALPVYDDGQEDPPHPDYPWARLVAIDTGEIEGGTGCADDGSSAPVVVTVNVTAPAAATAQNYYALSQALARITEALREDQSSTPDTGQTQQIHWDTVRPGIDPGPSETVNLRTGFVVATGIVSRTTD